LDKSKYNNVYVYIYEEDTLTNSYEIKATIARIYNFRIFNYNNKYNWKLLQVVLQLIRVIYNKNMRYFKRNLKKVSELHGNKLSLKYYFAW